MKKKIINWKTIFPAICIPLHDDYSINEPELRRYVRWLASFDEIGGLVCNGHTGEITSLSRAERKRVVEIVADEVGEQVMIISASTARTPRNPLKWQRKQSRPAQTEFC